MTGLAIVRDYVWSRPSQPQPSPRVVGRLPFCVTDDPAAARASVAGELAIYGQLPSYRAMLDREGSASPSDVAFAEDGDAVAAQILALAEAGVTDSVAAELACGQNREGPATC